MKRTVDSKFWTSQKVRKLPYKVKYLFQYFMTCPSTHMIGIYYVPMPTIIHETGLTEAEIREGIDTLSGSYLVHYDFLNSVIWVVNMLKHQGFKNLSEKLISAIHNQLNSLHESPLIDDFKAYYNVVSIGCGEGIDTLTVPVPNTNINLNIEEESKIRNLDKLKSAWNDLAEKASLPKAERMSKSRTTAARQRLNDKYFSDNWERALELILESEFLLGANGRSWRANIDWFLRPDSVMAIIEGKYRDAKKEEVDYREG